MAVRGWAARAMPLASYRAPILPARFPGVPFSPPPSCRFVTCGSWSPSKHTFHAHAKPDRVRGSVADPLRLHLHSIRSLPSRSRNKAVLSFSSPSYGSPEEDAEVTFDEETASSLSPREIHNDMQREYFDSLSEVFSNEDIPPTVIENLNSIVKLANLTSNSKIIDCGAGTGTLINILKENGFSNLTAVDLSPLMLSYLKENHDDVKCWNGDIIDFEDDKYDAIFFNAMFGNVFSQEDVLKKAFSLLNHGGKIIISHPMGNEFVKKLNSENSAIVPHHLPEKQHILSMTSDFTSDSDSSLNLNTFVEDRSFYLAILEKVLKNQDEKSSLETETILPHFPFYMKERIVSGFGRGSKKMGIPTANLPPEKLPSQITGFPKGVYFGFAQVPCVNSVVHKMVMNVGNRPTFVDGNQITVEVHVLNKFENDFYGEQLKVIVLGYIRPEMKFSSLDELVRRIHLDIDIAKTSLSEQKFIDFVNDPFFHE